MGIRKYFELNENENTVYQNLCHGDFPDGPVVKNLPSNAGDAGLIPG